MDRHVLFQRLLHIVLLLSFAFCTLPARLRWKSSPSPSPYDYTPIGQPSHSSDISPSLYDIIPFGQTPSPSVYQIYQYDIRTTLPAQPISETTNGTFTSVLYNVTYAASNPPAPTSGSTSTSAYANASANSTDGHSSASASASSNSTNSPSATAPSANFDVTSGPNLTGANVNITSGIAPPAGTSRSGMNVLGKVGTAIAVIVVSLAILIAVIKGFKKEKAVHNNVGESSGTDKDKDIRAYTTTQLVNLGGNSLEVGIIDTQTHRVDELNSLEEGDILTYTLEELADATENFTTKVGKGVSGFVYRTNLAGNRIGAVKRATDLDPKLFNQELSVLLRLPRHPHLVDLIGLCLQTGAPLFPSSTVFA